MKSQKKLKEDINRLETDELNISRALKQLSSDYEIVLKAKKESVELLQKICKHKNYYVTTEMVHRRMDYLDWEEPAIFYHCNDCKKDF